MQEGRDTAVKALWVCNIMLPFIARALGVSASNKEGWLTGIVNKVIENRKKDSAFLLELAVCFPAYGENCPACLEVDGIRCYAFREDLQRPETYDPALEVRFAHILADYQPDLLHCFGTEYGHTLAALRAFNSPKKSLTGIQGLCGACAKAYMADIPDYVQRRVTLRDFLRKDDLPRQQKKFALRGAREKEILRLTGNVTGRTAFDKRETAALNPKARYFFMNETLRRCFYEGAWDLKDCEKHSIFVSQGNYPLKGLHYVLWAMPKLLADFPDCKLYVAGDVITAHRTWKEKCKLSSYGKYLLELIREYRLESAVVFLGKLDAQQMKARFLASHVYVLASSLENSPNSLGEAMLLGVPCVASAVGGVPDMAEDGVEGLTYRAGDAAAMAACIGQIFTDGALARHLSAAATKRAATTHDGDANYARLLEIYETIGKG